MNEIKKADQPVLESQKKTEKKKSIIQRKLTKKEKRVIVVGASLIMLVASYFLIKRSIVISANALIDSYSAAYDSEREDTYQDYYKRFFDQAEKEYHVRNRGTISIGEMKEIGKLEVLEVSDVVFVVNMEEAEFVIDNEQAHVLVRVPYPELTNVSIDYSNVEKRLFKNDLFNDSYRVGEDLARKQLGEGDALIKKEFASNEHYYLTAQKAGISTIESLVRQLNPDEPDLVVDVEYY